MDLPGLLARYTVTAVPRRAPHGVIWQRASAWPVPALENDLDMDLRGYVATHIPRRSRSRLLWVPAGTR